MKRKSLIICALISTSAFSQTKTDLWKEIKQETKIGGYVIGKAAFNDQEKNKSNSTFDLRLVRAYINGSLMNFSYSLQMEMNGVAGTGTEKGPRVIDAWVEWKKYDFIKVKFGEFKRAFTFENPMNPWDIGFGAYSQCIDKLAGMNDRIGEHTSGGRDLGIQIQGDLFKTKNNTHNLLHYQIGIYNGQGINHVDQNNSKDIIGGLWISPLRNLSIGAFGWTGNYTKSLNNKDITVDRNRIAVGVKYESSWTVRSEYITSQGHKINDYKVENGQITNITGSDNADGWYTLIGAPVTDKCKIYAKWDVYRDQKNKETQKSIYGIAVNYYFHKNFKLQGLYNFTEDNSYNGDKHYNNYEIQVYCRF